MNRRLLAFARVLYGRDTRWYTAMANDLDVHHRTVRRWAKNDYKVPEGIWADLERVVAKRHREMADAVLVWGAEKSRKTAG